MIVCKVQFRGRIRGCAAAATSSALLLAVQLLWLLFTAASAHGQTFTVLHTFTGKGDGKWPYAGVMRDASSNLYGTTTGGGSFDFGTVFKINAQGKETILHSFWGGDGVWPEAGLVRDHAGNFYGTTWNGGKREQGGCLHGCGAVFKLDSTGKETVLYAFTAGTDGGEPQAGLVADQHGYLYGTAVEGGDLQCDYGWGCGVVFRVDQQGKESVLYAFASTSDGWLVNGDLIRDSAGNLYGVTNAGGTYYDGTVFKVDSAGKETVLYNFPGGASGMYPVGPLVRDPQGNLYGVASTGGDKSCFCGVVFKLDTSGNETPLYAFKGNPDGVYPYAGLIRDDLGNLYGTTSQGGTGGGTVYKVDMNGNETVLYSFTGAGDGGYPISVLARDSSGNLYGTAYTGGDSSCGYRGRGCGVVFKLTP